MEKYLRCVYENIIDTLIMINFKIPLLFYNSFSTNTPRGLPMTIVRKYF